MSEIKKMLSREETEDLFNREAVLINGADVVPASRAAELFGAAIVDHINAYEDKRKDGEGHFLTTWGAMNFERVTFLTWRGFAMAVTYHNAGIQAAKDDPTSVYRKALVARRIALSEGAGPLQALVAANIVLVAAGYKPVPWETEV